MSKNQSSSQFNEQSISFQQQSSVEDGPVTVERESKIIKTLIHLRDNRIFYFILAAFLLLFIAIMQIHTAYRTYEDNERLVKLWLQEKQLKDIMSHKNTQIKQVEAEEPEMGHKGNKSKIIIKSIQAKTLPKTQSSVSLIGADKTTKKIKNQTVIQKTQLSGNNLWVRGANQRTQLNTGIKRIQATAAKRWLELKNDNLSVSSQLSKQELEYYQSKYEISKYEELPFCIVIPSFNNVKNERHINNIKSVVMQDYANYHIVFIDDASTDGTGDQISDFMNSQTKLPQEKFLIIKNKEQMRAMPNLRRAAKEFCKPYQIFIIIDGDDQLIGRQVFKLYNSVFQKEKAWFVYSNFLSIRGNIGYSRPFPSRIISTNTYRKYPFVTSHLRAFYTQLFLNIQEKDLMDDSGNYLQAANDVAICIPILEQSHEKIYYLPQLTYYYNSNTGQNNHQIRLKQQKANDRMLRKRQPYTPLTSFYSIEQILLKKGKPQSLQYLNGNV